jgi:hypothetical protein
LRRRTEDRYAPEVVENPLTMRFLLVPALTLMLATAAFADLLPYGDRIQVTNDPTANNYGVATAVQADGSFLVVLSRAVTFPSGLGEGEVAEQAFDSTGAALGPIKVLDLGYNAFQTSAVALPNGSYVVAWTRNLGPWAQVVDGNGTPIGAPAVVPDSPVDDAGTDVRLTATALGFAAVWKHTDPAGPDTSGAPRHTQLFYVRLFGADGTPQGPALAETPESLPSSASPDPSVADLAALPSGGFILVWSRDQAPNPPPTLQALKLDAQGSPTAAEPMVVDSEPYFEGGMVPRVLVEPDGSCEIVWVHSGILAVRRLTTTGLSPMVLSTVVQIGSPGFQVTTDQHGHLYAMDGIFDTISYADLSHLLWTLDDSGHYSAGPITAMNTVLATTGAVAANVGGTAVVAWIGNGTGVSDHVDFFVRRFRSTCIPGGRQLCLGANGRFALEADWQTPDGNQGPATPSPVVEDSGGFWFFAASSVELFAKIVDGRALNGAFWLLWGGMTNVGVTLRVTDTLQGLTRTYDNPLGDFPSMADVNAFPDASLPPAPRPPAAQTAPGPRSATSPTCTATPGTLCLHGRFQVGVAFENGANLLGVGQVIPATYDSGYFWFFAPWNLEIAVKVLDGTAVNGHFWVFAASLSNVQFAITLTDTVTGEVRVYDNPPGIMRSFGDTTAF